MTPEQSRLDEASRWLAQAQKDLNAARLLASPEPSRSVSTASRPPRNPRSPFLYFTTFPSGRHTTWTNWATSSQPWIRPLVPLFQEAANLTDYAVLFRYLDAPREPDESEARVALETAFQVFQGISALLAPPDQE